MASADVKSFQGESRGSVPLADDVFGIHPNKHAVYEAVKAYQANQRQGTHKVKGRSEVSGGGIKPWKQKGTGRARAGSNTSPVWVRGGSVFGPRPRDYRMEIPKKVRRLALRSALSDRAKTGKLIVIDDLALPEAKTKTMAKFLAGIGLEGKSCLIVVDRYDEAIHRAARNIQRVEVRVASRMAAYDVVRAEWLVMSREALAAIHESAAREEESK